MPLITTYTEEMRIVFIKGEESIEKIEEYIKQLEKFGMKEVIACRQTVFDLYMRG